MASALALVLYLSPVIRAYNAGRRLGVNLELAFRVIELHGDSGDVDRINTGKAQMATAQKEMPFRWQQMFTGIGTAKIASRTLTYESAAGAPPLTLDLYPAQRPGLRPCVIVIHGGSWSGGDSRQLTELKSRLAKDCYTVAAINYRLAPRYQRCGPGGRRCSAVLIICAATQRSCRSIPIHLYLLEPVRPGHLVHLLAAYTLPDARAKRCHRLLWSCRYGLGLVLFGQPAGHGLPQGHSGYLGGAYDVDF